MQKAPAKGEDHTHNGNRRSNRSGVHEQNCENGQCGKGESALDEQIKECGSRLVIDEARNTWQHCQVEYAVERNRPRFPWLGEQPRYSVDRQNWDGSSAERIQIHGRGWNRQRFDSPHLAIEIERHQFDRPGLPFGMGELPLQKADGEREEVKESDRKDGVSAGQPEQTRVRSIQTIEHDAEEEVRHPWNDCGIRFGLSHGCEQLSGARCIEVQN